MSKINKSIMDKLSKNDLTANQMKFLKGGKLNLKGGGATPGQGNG